MSEEVDSLEHFGIKGMKWGVVRDRESNGRVGGAPSVVSNIREARGNLYDKKAGTLRAKVAGLRKENPNGEQRSVAQSEKVRTLNQKADRAELDATRVRQGQITGLEKTILAGSVAAGAVVASGAMSTVINQRAGLYADLVTAGAHAIVLGAAGTAFVKVDSGSLNKTENFKRNESLAAKMTPTQAYSKVVKGINPGYGDIGTMNNCRRATFAYEMRRRGYDVKATKTLIGTGQTAHGLLEATSKSRRSDPNLTRKEYNKRLIDSVEKGQGEIRIPKKVVNGLDVVSAKSVFDTIEKQPVGSRGELALHWLAGGAHSVAYERFKEGPVVFDTQSGKMFNKPLDMQNKFGNFVDRAAITRLDNAELSHDYLQRWLVDAD